MSGIQRRQRPVHENESRKIIVPVELSNIIKNTRIKVAAELVTEGGPHYQYDF